MNKAYKTVYNEQTGTFVAVAENTTTRGKKTSSARRLRNVVIAVAASLAASSAAFADVDIDNDTNTIEFVGGAGTITNVGSITGLQDLTIGGELEASKIIVGTGGDVVNGSMEVVTGGQLFAVQEALNANITANADAIANQTSQFQALMIVSQKTLMIFQV